MRKHLLVVLALLIVLGLVAAQCVAPAAAPPAPAADTGGTPEFKLAAIFRRGLQHVRFHRGDSGPVRSGAGNGLLRKRARARCRASDA